jgi:hypothetical protein
MPTRTGTAAGEGRAQKEHESVDHDPAPIRVVMGG